MKDLLDHLGARARRETPVSAPSHPWLQQRRDQRRWRRRVAAGAIGAVGLAGGALTGSTLLPESGSSERTEAVADPAETEDGHQPQPTPTTMADDGAEAEVTPTTTADTACGNWPTGFELWPNQDPSPPIDTVTADGQGLRRQTSGEHTLEIRWPPSPQPDYDLDHAGPELGESRLWVASQRDVTSFGISTAAPTTATTEPVPGSPANHEVEFLRLVGDDPTLAALEGRCAEFELRLLANGGENDDGELIEHFGIGLGRSVTLGGGSFDWLQFGPIVVEQRSVDAVPPSVRCSGVLVDLDTTAYRVDESVAQSVTLAEAIASGQFVVIDDPMAESQTADPDEWWAVLLPDTPTNATLGELSEQGLLSLISASTYEDFVDPETGPTSGPGLDGHHEQPIDALKAFFDHPAAESFIKTGLIELLVDDSTVAYGVPQGHGEGGWITVITVETAPDTDGWNVTGWTSAGC